MRILMLLAVAGMVGCAHDPVSDCWMFTWDKRALDAERAHAAAEGKNPDAAPVAAQDDRRVAGAMLQGFGQALQNSATAVPPRTKLVCKPDPFNRQQTVCEQAPY